jgi:hypothetical protein
MIAELGEERTASPGDILIAVGDDTFPFLAILEGEVVILDGEGNEMLRQGPGNVRVAARAPARRH